MEFDKKIAALGARLDAWFDEMDANIEAGDQKAQIKTLLAGIQIPKQFDDLKQQGLAALATLLNSADVTSEGERVASLLRGFEFAVGLQATLDYEMGDVDGYNQVDRVVDDIVVALASIGSGRTALVPLLGHGDPRLRVSAGQYLIDLTPDRVIPVLQQVEKEAPRSSERLNAHWILLAWELERKGRFDSLATRVTRS
jgi:hypothetical protein